MVLDALAAVGLAGNLVQFIEFGCSLVSEAREIHDSIRGSSKKNDEHEVIAARLQQLSSNLSSSSYRGVVVGQQLQDLAEEATAISNELLQAIEAVRLKGSNGNFRSFAHALQHVGKNKSIGKIAGRLARMQGQLNTHMLFMLSDKHSETLKQLRALDAETRRLGMQTATEIDTIRKEILHEIHNLQSDSSMLNLYNKLHNLSFEGEVVRRDQLMLNRLSFKIMKVRESRIVEAHTKTFRWIFEEMESDSASARFVDWLKNQDGVYWIMGKPGSGKSTLMKYLARHHRTREALLHWARPRKLITANFFFWNGGTELQKSQEGLLRSLLFEILRQWPAMIPQILGKWLEDDCYEDHISPWSTPDLLECFSNLREQTEHSTRFCFFIDGLDEYEGECSDLIKALQGLSDSPIIKICASSRPWFDFKDAFGQSPQRMLKLEDLTREDIALYVNDTLSSHPRFTILQARNACYLELIDQIVNKACGVFLWVFLVTTSLRRGLTNADSISVLQKRISLLPESLDDYFRHILGTVESVYRTQTAKMFQYALHAPPSGPIPLIVFSYLDEEDPDFALQIKVRDLSACEVEVRYDEIRRRLDGRTRGLLEAVAPASITQVPTVDFLHRTVRDFFLTKSIQDMLNADLDANFAVDIDLCRAFLAQMKLGPWYTAEDCLGSVMFHLHEAEERTETASPVIVEEIRKTICSPTSSWKIDNFDDFLVDHNIYYSLADRLEEIPRSSPSGSSDNRPLLDVALRHRKGSGQRYQHPKTINLLLKMGADPNETFGDGLSVWANFLLMIYDHRREGTRDNAVLHILELLLSHGADLDEIIPLTSQGGPGRVLTANKIIQKVFPRDADWLLSKYHRDQNPNDDWLMIKSNSEQNQSTNGGWLRWIQDQTSLRS